MEKKYLQTHMPLEDWFLLASGGYTLELEAARWSAIEQGHRYLREQLSQKEVTWYGVNTGFGALCDTRIEPQELELLQENLVKSHACGSGPEAKPEVVRLMLALKVHALAHGYSAVSRETVEGLLAFYNEDMLPAVPVQGSLGASGDLAPLAHLTLPLLGLGFCTHQGRRLTGAEALHLMGRSPLRLGAKEGLALLNGTQFMLATGLVAMSRAKRLENTAMWASALSCEVFLASEQPFDSFIHQLRPHPGQISVANQLRLMWQGSALRLMPRPSVQDPYAFRCIPQVHGTSRDVLAHSGHILSTETDAVTDNPLVDFEQGRVLSGGNFHGQVLAMCFDHMALALAELGSISERRTYQLLGGTRGLPPFLALRSGVESGLMIVQYTAAALVSHNKQLAVPCVTDSIPSSNGQEDHVSMGANGANRLIPLLDNLEQILAIEWLVANRALIMRDKDPGLLLRDKTRAYLDSVPLPVGDAVWSEILDLTRTWLQENFPDS